MKRSVGIPDTANENHFLITSSCYSCSNKILTKYLIPYCSRLWMLMLLFRTLSVYSWTANSISLCLNVLLFLTERWINGFIVWVRSSLWSVPTSLICFNPPTSPLWSISGRANLLLLDYISGVLWVLFEHILVLLFGQIILDILEIQWQTVDLKDYWKGCQSKCEWINMKKDFKKGIIGILFLY